MDFRDYVRKKYLKKTDRILEFGPLIRPTATKSTHPGIRFADVRSTEEIKELYNSNDYLESTGLTVDINSVVDIDYVVKGSYKDTFKGVDKFNVVILSHVIEHMPDIIEFFQDITNVLDNNGRLIIIYPDARYCFDHFRNGTSFIDAYDVYLNKSNSSKRVFDFVFNVVNENDASFFWNNLEENKIIPINDFNKAVKAYDKSFKGELPDDTHFWPFSNYQLIKFLYDMDRAGLLAFDIEKFYPTPENHQECMVVLKLKNSKKVNHTKYKKIFDEVSPYIEDIEARANKRLIASAKDEIESLQRDNSLLKNELEKVYSSKKWRYGTKAAKFKNLITGNVKRR